MVIQLKRIGESNCKFYKTQSTENQTPNSNTNNDSCTGTKATTGSTTDNLIFYDSYHENNNEIPLLLGSLIYDEDWFKSTIDNG